MLNVEKINSVILYGKLFLSFFEYL